MDHPYISVDQYMNMVRPIIKEQLNTQIVQRKSALSSFMQEVWKQEFRFNSRSQRHNYIKEKMEYLANKDLALSNLHMEREETKRTISLLEKAHELRNETQKFSFQKRYFIDPTTDKLNRMQKQTMSYQADPNFVHQLNVCNIDHDKLKNQIIEMREKQEPSVKDSNDIQLKQLTDDEPQLIKESSQERLREHFRQEGQACLAREKPISRLISTRDKKLNLLNQELSRIDRALQSEIISNLGRDVADQPLYLSRNMGLRTQQTKKRSISCKVSQTLNQRPETRQPDLRIMSRGRPRSQIKQIETNGAQQQIDLPTESREIKDYIDSKVQSPKKPSFWINNRKQFSYTSRRRRTPKMDDEPDLVRRNCRSFRFSEISTNSWTNNI